MSGSVFLETLRRSWRGTLYWALGIALMGVYVVAVIPDVKMLKQYGELVKTMPKMILAAVGGDAANLATPEGFFGYSFFGWIMLVMATFGVVAGLNITANEEDRGIMDVLLSLPLPRWRIVVEKFLAYVVMVVFIALVSFVSVWVLVQNSSVFTLSTARLAEGMFNLIPSTLLVIAFTALVATLVRRRNVAMGIAATFVVASYFVDVIGRSADSVGGLRALSFYSYYNGSEVLVKGIVWGSVIGLLIIAVLMIGGATAAFQRRDVGV